MSRTSTEPPLCESPDPAPAPPSPPLPDGACDAHTHVFGPADRYPLVSDRTYTPAVVTEEDHRRLLRTLGFQRVVLVQASVYGTDNRCMLDTLAARRDDPGIAYRGVAVVDERVDDAELERMHELGVRGVRINLLFRGGVGFSVARALSRRIAALGWHLQLLIDVSQVEGLADELAALPVDAVVDHMGHVPTRQGVDDPGFRTLLELLREGRTWVKLSGPNRTTAQERAPFTDTDAFARALVETRPDRCVFGTDWPHVHLPTPMPRDTELVEELYRQVPDAGTRRRILVDNPAALYGF